MIAERNKALKAFIQNTKCLAILLLIFNFQLACETLSSQSEEISGRKAPITFEPIAMLDPRRGYPIVAQTWLRLSDGSRAQASEFFSSLNEIEKRINESGLTLRNYEIESILNNASFDEDLKNMISAKKIYMVDYHRCYREYLQDPQIVYDNTHKDLLHIIDQFQILEHLSEDVQRLKMKKLADTLAFHWSYRNYANLSDGYVEFWELFRKLRSIVWQDPSPDELKKISNFQQLNVFRREFGMRVLAPVNASRSGTFKQGIEYKKKLAGLACSKKDFGSRLQNIDCEKYNRMKKKRLTNDMTEDQIRELEMQWTSLLRR